MAINSIETITLFQQACDQQMIEGSTSGWMEANAAQTSAIALYKKALRFA